MEENYNKIRQNQIPTIKKALRDLFEIDEEISLWDPNFIRNDELLLKIIDDIEHRIAEKNRINISNSNKLSSHAEISSEYTVKIQNYITDLKKFIDFELIDYLHERYYKIIKIYKKIESTGLNVNQNSNRLFKYIYECYIKDKCAKLDHQINLTEINRITSKAVSYTPADYKTDIHNLKSKIFKEIESTKSSTPNKQKQYTTMIRTKWFVFNCLKKIFEYGVQDPRLFDVFANPKNNSEENKPKLSIKSIACYNNSSAGNSVNNEFKTDPGDKNQLTLDFPMSPKMYPLTDIINGVPSSRSVASLHSLMLPITTSATAGVIVENPTEDLGELGKRGEPGKSR